MATATKKPSPEKQNVEDIIRYRETGDEEILNEMFRRNAGLCNYVSNRYMNTGHRYDDLFSLCQFGMLKAINSFKLEKDIKFATYATRCMENEILMMLRNDKKHQMNQSMETTIAVSTKDGEALRLEDILGDDNRDIKQFEVREEADYALQVAEAILNDFEKKVFYNAVSDLPYTQKEMSKQLGLSQSYISRVEARVLKKVRIMLEKKERILPKAENKPKTTKRQAKALVQKKELEKPMETKELKQETKSPREARKELSRRRKQGYVWIMKHAPNMPTRAKADMLRTSAKTVMEYDKAFKDGEMSSIEPVKPSELDLEPANLYQHNAKRNPRSDREQPKKEEPLMQVKVTDDDVKMIPVPMAEEVKTLGTLPLDEPVAPVTVKAAMRIFNTDPCTYPSADEQVKPPVMDIALSGASQHTIETLLKALSSTSLSISKTYKLKLVVEEE